MSFRRIFFSTFKIQKKKSHTREDTGDRGTAHIDNSLHLYAFTQLHSLFSTTQVWELFFTGTI